MSFEILGPFRGVFIIPQTRFGSPDLRRAFSFDAVFNQSYGFSSTITEQAVEHDDINIADGIIISPETFSCDAKITDTPIRLLNLVSPTIQAWAFGGPGVNRAIKLHNLLLQDIYEKKELVTIRTTMRVMRNMVIESINSSRDKGTGAAINVSVSFRKVRVVTTGLVPAVQDEDVQAQGGAGILDAN